MRWRHSSMLIEVLLVKKRAQSYYRMYEENFDQIRWRCMHIGSGGQVERNMLARNSKRQSDGK